MVLDQLQVEMKNKSFSIRFSIVLFTSVLVLLTSGILYGFANMQLVLHSEKVFFDLCDEPSETELTSCSEQDLRLNLIYTIGAAANLLCALLWGLFLDRSGPRKTLFFSSATFLSGCLILAVARWYPFLYFVGFTALATSGLGVFYGLIPTSSLLEKENMIGTAVGLYNTCFDASAGVFFIFRLITKSGDVHSSTLFLVYSVVGITGIIYSIFWIKDVNPKTSEEKEQEDQSRTSEFQNSYEMKEEETDHNEKTDHSEEKDHSEERDHSEEKDNRNEKGKDLENSEEEENASTLVALEEDDQEQINPSEPVPFELDLAQLPFQQQARFSQYWLLFLLVPMTILFLNNYLGSAELWLGEFTTPEKAASLTEIFGFILPSVVIASPLIGQIVDRGGLALSFLLNQLLGVMWTLTSFVSSPIEIQILTFIFFTFQRGVFFSVFMTYIIKVFGYQNFGKIYGSLAFVSGFVNFAQYLFNYIAVKNGNHFAFFKIAQLIFFVALIAFPIYLHKKKIK